ncbi:DsbA family protein [Staphylococcus xylosus]
MKKIIILVLVGSVILFSCNKINEQPKNEIVMYGDYKCPYCQEVEKKVMPKLKEEYIDTGKVKFTFINMAFLGEDSIKGSRAGHAVKNIAPDSYLDFQKSIYDKQPKDEGNWITITLLDSIIDNLNISEDKKSEIKKDYKTPNSKSWEDAKKDLKLYKKNKVTEAPTVKINGKEIEDPYNFAKYKKELNNE